MQGKRTLVHRTANDRSEPITTTILRRGECPLKPPPRQLSIERGRRDAYLVSDDDPFALRRFPVKIEPGVKTVRDPSQAQYLDPRPLRLNGSCVGLDHTHCGIGPLAKFSGKIAS